MLKSVRGCSGPSTRLELGTICSSKACASAFRASFSQVTARSSNRGLSHHGNNVSTAVVFPFIEYAPIQLGKDEQAEFMKKAGALAPKYRTELLKP